MSEAFHKAFLVVSVRIRGMARAAERAAEPQLFGARPNDHNSCSGLAMFGNVWQRFPVSGDARNQLGYFHKSPSYHIHHCLVVLRITAEVVKPS